MKVKYLKKLMLLGITVLLLNIPATKAEVNIDVNVSIELPPLIVFSEPPQVVVLPETYVYVAPEVEVDIFFYDGWWWRPWNGHWYRSHYYNRSWVYYSSVPIFYVDVYPDWRDEYRKRQWKGNPWNYERIHPKKVRKNWKTWKRNKYWEKNKTWGVKGLKPQPKHKVKQHGSPKKHGPKGKH